MEQNINIIEEALLDSIPAMQTVHMGGWVIRMNHNYTYRANCVCPLGYTGEKDARIKIPDCEKLFIANQLPPVFKVTSAIQKGLAEVLLSQNYENIKTVKVMCCELKEAPIMKSTEVKIRSMENPDEDWLAASARLTGVVKPELADIHCQSLKNIALKRIFIEAVSDGKIVGCGYGTNERGYTGIYDLHVDNSYRCMGIGTAICREIFCWGMSHNAKTVYLIVHSQNKNAISLYSHMGFSTCYKYSFYCKKDSGYEIADA